VGAGVTLSSKPAYERVVELVAAAAEALPVGDPREEVTRVAPLVDPAATERVRSWIDEAVRAGARYVVGGGQGGGILGPTVLADVPAEATIWTEEVFGPVIGLRPVASFDEGLDAVNASAYGLHASVFTHDLRNVLAAADRLEVGGVVVNEVPGFRADNMPYGGVKRSETGREGPRFAIEEFTVTRMILIRP
jgi:acyl-CoA reductase-like NAD-dependent aldehyde dehydrogenase